MRGANKLLETLEGAPIVRRAARVLDDARIVDRIVVTARDAQQVDEALAGLDFRSVHNADAAEGISSSIRTGVRAVSRSVSGVLVVPGDMPWLTRDDVTHVLDAFDPDSDRSICIPVHAGRRGNPVLWGVRHLDALADLAGDTGGRQLFGRLAHEVREVPVPGDGVLRDVDTPEEMRRARGEEE